MAACPRVILFPQKPTQISIENIAIEIDIFEDVITIVVNWEPPEYANGNLTYYDVCLSEEELEGEEECNVFSLINVPPDILTLERTQLIQTTQLAVQVHTLLLLLEKCHTNSAFCNSASEIVN